MASLSYDLIVLGDDFPGLIAATLCASRGMRVLLALTREERQGYRLEGRAVPVSPLVLCGLDASGITGVMEELNFEHSLRRKLVPREIPFQLLAPKLRLDLDSDSEKLSDSSFRETGEDASWLLECKASQESLEAFLSGDTSLLTSGFWERREVSNLLSATDLLAQEWLEAAPFSSISRVASLCHGAASHGANPHPIAVARSVSSLLQGVPIFSGGADRWRELFLEKFQSHSGECRLVGPQAIQTRWGKIAELICVDDQIRCDHLIAAMPLVTLASLLPDKQSRSLLQKQPLPAPVAFRFSLNLLVDPAGIPAGLSSLAASILRPEEGLTGGNFAIIETNTADSADIASVCLEGLAPISEEGDPELDGMKDALLRHAEERMPFLAQHIVAWDSPHLEATKGVDRNLRAPLQPQAVWSSPSAALTRLGALPYASGIRNLYLANDQSLPSLGLEGQFISAVGASKLVAKAAGKGKSSAAPSVLSTPR